MWLLNYRLICVIFICRSFVLMMIHCSLQLNQDLVTGFLFKVDLITIFSFEYDYVIISRLVGDYNFMIPGEHLMQSLAKQTNNSTTKIGTIDSIWSRQTKYPGEGTEFLRLLGRTNKHLQRFYVSSVRK